VAGLVLAQAGLALGLFGSGRSWAAVTDDRPVLSGRHPLHLYHGSLGARAFRDHGATTLYDPAFHAGYPKTPVFDGGCRPAELVLVLAGGSYRPGAYKFGLFACLALVPLVFVVAARGAGLPAGAAVLAGACGAGLAWHLGLLGITTAGLAPNLWWLTDWGRYWWLRQPSPSDHIPLPGWEAILGGPGDYTGLFGCLPGGGFVVLAGAVGLVVVWRA